MRLVPTVAPALRRGIAMRIGIRTVFGGRTKHNEKVVSRVDIVDRALVALVFVGSIVLPALYLFTSWLGFADYRLPAFIPWCGAILMVIALWLFWRAHVDLGLNLVHHAGNAQRS